MSRHDVIEALVQAGLEGMTSIALHEHATNDEIVSAYFTLLRRGVAAAMTITPNAEKTRLVLRTSLFTILADLVDPKLH
jgi:hypothetical protein